MSNNALAIVLLTVLWLVFVQSTDANHIVLGAVLSSLIVFTMAWQQSDKPRMLFWPTVSLILFVAKEFIMGSLRVSWDVITPGSRATPFVTRYNLPQEFTRAGCLCLCGNVYAG